MVASIQRWGNSLAIRIPKAFAEQAQIDENSAVEISIEGDRITIAPARRGWKLEELVRKISPDNLHREVKWGGKTGKEAW
jgi:antitoxin MazE